MQLRHQGRRQCFHNLGHPYHKWQQPKARCTDSDFFRFLRTKPEPDKLNGYEWLSQFQRCSNNSGNHYQIKSCQCTTQLLTRTRTYKARCHKMKNPPPEYVAKSDTLVAAVNPSFMVRCQFELPIWSAELCAYFHLLFCPGVGFDAVSATERGP